LLKEGVVKVSGMLELNPNEIVQKFPEVELIRDLARELDEVCRGNFTRAQAQSKLGKFVTDRQLLDDILVGLTPHLMK